MLIAETGHPIVIGMKVKNNLYKMDVSLQMKEKANISNKLFNNEKTCANKVSWEMWHKWYGHVSYEGLQVLYNQMLVHGLDVDLNSAKLDCVACMEAKLTKQPHKMIERKKTSPSELTHIDV
jgi:hypothetical protein